jgi:hypothetical protein
VIVNGETGEVTLTSQEFYRLSLEFNHRHEIELACIYAWLLLHPEKIDQSMVSELSDDFHHFVGPLFNQLNQLRDEALARGEV